MAPDLPPMSSGSSPGQVAGGGSASTVRPPQRDTSDVGPTRSRLRCSCSHWRCSSPRPAPPMAWRLPSRRLWHRFRPSSSPSQRWPTTCWRSGRLPWSCWPASAAAGGLALALLTAVPIAAAVTLRRQRHARSRGRRPRPGAGRSAGRGTRPARPWLGAGEHRCSRAEPTLPDHHPSARGRGRTGCLPVCRSAPRTESCAACWPPAWLPGSYGSPSEPPGRPCPRATSGSACWTSASRRNPSTSGMRAYTRRSEPTAHVSPCPSWAETSGTHSSWSRCGGSSGIGTAEAACVARGACSSSTRPCSCSWLGSVR